MKKFSNQEIKKEIKIISPKIDKIIDILINENINIQYNGDEKEIDNKNLSIDGIEILKEKLNEFIDVEVEKAKTQLNESIKYNFNYVDQNLMNEKIKLLEDTIYNNVIPTPEDIFSYEDYELGQDDIKLTTLNNMPNNYLDFINNENAYKYFNEGNSIKIRFQDGWNLYFEPNYKEFGTNIDDKNTKYKKFVESNNDFIGDFLKATSNLIGADNLMIDSLLISTIQK